VTALESLAELVHDVGPESLSASALDKVKLHLLDTVGAMVAGADLEEGRALARFLKDHENPRGIAVPGFTTDAPVDTAILTSVAACRATEMDDIHLASCTTPGSVVVPTVLALTATGAITSPMDLAAAIVAGYETLIRVGLAIDGPAALSKRVWPTLFAAPFASAAVCARAYRLGVHETAGAFATALASTSGTPIRPRSDDTSRWLTLGAAARSGVLAVDAAHAGIVGPTDLLEQNEFRLSGVSIAPEPLMDRSTRYLLEDTGLKPYPIARQALAAVDACRQLCEDLELDPSAVDEILVSVPEPQRRVIDRAELPDTRIASIISVQYRIALGFVAPEKLADVRCTPPFVNDTVRELMARVRVEAAPDLEPRYPLEWPARVEIKSGDERYELEVLHPTGDVESDFGWDEVQTKFLRAVRPAMERDAAEAYASCIETLESAALEDLLL